MFVGTHGTGTLECAKKMGYIDGAPLDPKHVFVYCYGTMLYP